MALDGDELGIDIWNAVNALSNSEKQDTEEVWKLISTKITDHIENKLGNVPIGAIIPWHKSFANTPALASGFVECNGQTLNDADSVYDGQVIPNLNGDGAGANSPGHSTKEQMFLRGGTTSGTGENDQIQSHKHTDSGHAHPSYPSSVSAASGAARHARDGGGSFKPSTGSSIANLGDPTTSTQGTPRHGSETRSKNMSIVFIMRIK